jgi:hypothetical protein
VAACTCSSSTPWLTTTSSAGLRCATSTSPWREQRTTAVPDPYDRALLVWTAPRAVVERFAEQDPYVVQGLVTGWSIREWNVVIG